LNSPWVLICVGGVLPGESAVDPVVSIVSHGCVERIVARKDCMFVWGTCGPQKVDPNGIRLICGPGNVPEQSGASAITHPR
jgi:hypothetical protein